MKRFRDVLFWLHLTAGLLAGVAKDLAALQQAGLTEEQLKERIGSYFNSDAPLESLNLSLVDLH